MNIILLLLLPFMLCEVPKEPTVAQLLSEINSLKLALQNHIQEDHAQLWEKIKTHETIDFKSHQEIVQEDGLDDAKISKLNTVLNTHLKDQNVTFLSQVIRSLATIVTGVGLGALIHQAVIPDFIHHLFEYKLFRFAMIVILAWQGGAGYDIMISIIGSSVFLLVFYLVK
jgi:hypothetical protein